MFQSPINILPVETDDTNGFEISLNDQDKIGAVKTRGILKTSVSLYLNVVVEASPEQICAINEIEANNIRHICNITKAERSLTIK